MTSGTLQSAAKTERQISPGGQTGATRWVVDVYVADFKFGNEACARRANRPRHRPRPTTSRVAGGRCDRIASASLARDIVGFHAGRWGITQTCS
jgi:hypothetical protein